VAHWAGAAVANRVAASAVESKKRITDVCLSVIRSNWLLGSYPPDFDGVRF
jgi:hypothetical protein